MLISKCYVLLPIQRKMDTTKFGQTVFDLRGFVRIIFNHIHGGFSILVNEIIVANT